MAGVGCMKSGVLDGNVQHSAHDVFQGVQSRGATADEAVSWVAIAKRESQFNSKAYCINYGGRGTDRGIFQLNSIAWHDVPDSKAYDFDGNLDATKGASKNWKDFGPWGGPPTKAMRDAAAKEIDSKTVIGNPTVGDPVATAIAGPINSVVDFLKLLANPDTWFRVGKVLLGGVLIIVAVGGTIYVVTKQETNSIKVKG